MSTKYYIELEASQFIVDAENVGCAIALLWCRELDPLRNFTAEQLRFVRWSNIQVEPEYYIHQGQREHGRYVHSRKALPYLTRWQIKLAVQAIADQYDSNVLKSFAKGKRRGY